MDLIILIGRILFVVLFLSSGMGHLRNSEAMAGYAKSRNVPAARPAVIVSGVMILVGGLSVLLGIWADLGALLLFLFLVPAAFLMHGFWRETDPQARRTEQIQFFKDIALAGASLMLVGLFSQADPGLMITGPLF